jgi:hypothetical protein
MVNWSDPQTFWLNVMNAALGAVCLVCIALFLVSVAQEVAAWVRQRSAKVAQLHDHAFSVPGLGLTMADGGEPLDPDDRKAKPATAPQQSTKAPDEPEPR